MSTVPVPPRLPKQTLGDWLLEHAEANHLQPNAPFGGKMFETYGQEIEHVRRIAGQEPYRIHTVVDGSGTSLYLIPGLHFINRLGFIITPFPFDGYVDTRI